MSGYALPLKSYTIITLSMSASAVSTVPKMAKPQGTEPTRLRQC